MGLFLNKIDSPLGEMLLVTDSQGIVRALDFANHSVRLQRELRERFSGFEPRENVETEAVKAISGKIERYFEGDLTALDDIAVAADGTDFQRLVWAGLTPKAYASAHRARRMRERLNGSNASITNAIYDAGFNSNSRFYEASDRILGMRAKDYRAGGANAAIRFAVGQSSLGSILVAQSKRGVCAILLGDDPEKLVRDLQDQFLRADLIGGDESFEKLVAQVVGFVEAPQRGLKLPLDLQGTAFQERVWQALRKIPVGTTVSYADIAKRIGKPKAVRAVAQACGANHLAVAIPCHRVVRRDGDLSGYRWGVDRKRELLEREKRSWIFNQKAHGSKARA
jgi:AraC family transcriptional regulator of adaptative response/methylated-DNA-[protein]-cysteine methyltransferase